MCKRGSCFSVSLLLTIVVLSMCFLPSSSISHTRSHHQGTDERLPTVRHTQAGEPAWPPVVTAWCPSSSQSFVIYTLAVRLKIKLALQVSCVLPHVRAAESALVLC